MPRKDIDPVQFHVPKGKRELIKQYAEDKGMELSDYLRGLVEADMNRGKRRKDERIDLYVAPGAPRPKKSREPKDS